MWLGCLFQIEGHILIKIIFFSVEGKAVQFDSDTCNPVQYCQLDTDTKDGENTEHSYAADVTKDALRG